MPLTITRKVHEGIVIGDSILVNVVAIRGNRVELSIDAPQEIDILRDELVSFQLPQPTSPEPSAA